MAPPMLCTSSHLTGVSSASPFEPLELPAPKHKRVSLSPHVYFSSGFSDVLDGLITQVNGKGVFSVSDNSMNLKVYRFRRSEQSFDLHF